MNARRVDPRDIEIDIEPLAYRVHFWTPPSSDTQPLWSADEWELEQCDVVEAAQWAEANRAGRTFTLTAVIVSGSNLGQVLLAGEDPTRRAP